MTPSPVFRQTSEDPAARRAFDNITATQQNIDKKILSGILIENISVISASTNIISHGLGRNYIGYILVKSSSFCDLKENKAAVSASDLRLVLPLDASANSTISLWIF